MRVCSTESSAYASGTFQLCPEGNKLMKVCVVGAGYYAQFHLAAWARMSGVEIVGIADMDSKRARQAVVAWPDANVFHDAEDMVHRCKPDLVDIITPEATHGPLVGLLAGKSRTLMCQKPMAPTLEAARVMADVASQAGTELLIHENFRFQPWFREARHLLDEGVLGVPQQLTFRFRPGDGRGPDAYLQRQPYFRTMKHFLVHETVVHYTDTFRYLLGEVRCVTARLRRVNPAIAGEDAGIVVYEFASGAIAILDANRDLEHDAAEPRYTQGSMLLEGGLATWRLDGMARTWLRRRGQASETHHTSFARVVPNGDSVFNYLTAMVKALSGDSASNADIEASRASAYLHNVEIEQAIYQSAAEGRTITL